jgi:hypothetical protein
MIDAMKQALEALEKISRGGSPEWADNVIPPLRKAIEQAETWDTSDMAHRAGGLSVEQAHTDHPMRHWDRTCPACVAEAEKQEPVNIHCPSCLHSFSVVPVTKREWVGLTDEEVWDAYEKGMYEEMWFARAVEAKLKERNT